eukprot:767484-Hanusia_phi.AAC.3
MIFLLCATLAVISPCSAYLFPPLNPASSLPRFNSQLCPLPRTGSAVFGLNRHVRAEQRNFGALSSMQMVTINDLQEEYEIDYRQADLTGQRLFVTGLPSSMDDLRLYLAFEGFGTILEAHVAKPGLGFVVFEDAETADDALDAMANTEISGKEVRVKRARSFYIKKEEEARLKMAKMAKDRENKMKMIALEQNERARALEEEHYLDAHLTSQRPLSTHMRDFDPRFKKRAIIQVLECLACRVDVTSQQEMHDEGMLSNVYENITFVRRTSEATLASVAQGHTALGQDRRISRSPFGRDERARMNKRQMQSPPKESDEERIRKQAMIEIMKEGDKLTKSGLKEVDSFDIDMAKLIRERCEQIRRYEMLKENKGLLEQITFTSSVAGVSAREEEAERRDWMSEFTCSERGRGRGRGRH